MPSSPHQIRAKKSLWQNFLIDEDALSDIATATDIFGKNIIEVGPGYGALTKHLIELNPADIELVELDDDMLPLLSESFPGITIHHTDVLRFIPNQEEYSVIANIPYYITSPILFHFLYDIPHAPENMVIMMQKEVGEKILAGRASKPHHSLLSLSMEQACENIEAIRYVWRNSFRPAPKVDSIVLKFIVKQDRNRETEERLIKLWEKAFTHPRKTLLSNLKWHYDEWIIKSWLSSCWYDEKVRAEAVKREDWKKLLMA